MTKTYEQAKFIVTRNVVMFTTIAMIALSLENFLTNGENLLTALVALGCSLAIFGYLLVSQKYKTPALVAVILGFGLNTYNLTRASNFENYVDLFWIINMTLFAYFTLHKIIGHFYLVINIATVLAISILVKEGTIVLHPASNVYNFDTYLDLIFNILICTLFFGYLISQFLIQTQKARADALMSNVELQKQYDEKSVMLREIHHRVKNNLQVITSLLRLQLYKIDNVETAAPFNESIDRISSMSLIHEKMYQGNLVSNIDLEEYIHDLANSLAQNYAYETKVELQVRSSVKSIDLNYIVPFSLILNELITNSIKHGFKNTKSGSISIKLALNKAGRLKFDYIDSGTWKPQLDQESFGLELIETFAEQIGGTYKVSTNTHTEYNFVFSDDIVAK